jgi:hypothetical protein
MADLKILFPDSFNTIEIEGQIKECPQKERNFYRIQWNTDTKGVDSAWLQTTLDNTVGTNKQLLQVAMEEMEPV